MMAMAIATVPSFRNDLSGKRADHPGRWRLPTVMPLLVSQRRARRRKFARTTPSSNAIGPRLLYCSLKSPMSILNFPTRQ